MVFPRQEEYTDEAKEALSRAQAWVFDMRNSQMDAEHLLIGFISIDNGMTEKILSALDVKIENLRMDLENAIRLYCNIKEKQLLIYHKYTLSDVFKLKRLKLIL